MMGVCGLSTTVAASSYRLAAVWMGAVAPELALSTASPTASGPPGVVGVPAAALRGVKPEPPHTRRSIR